ncbi:MAG: EFR1 family ferrodoxin [Muribaculaceae bacterium]|nr:EFR1 family ferrodoxin [Muribaculaceae bacterium]
MIIVFSGCGNTMAAASCLAGLTGEELLRLGPEQLRADTPEPRLAASGERIIWAFPTYSWGVPPVMRRFIRRVSIAGADTLPHFMLTTCGDDTGLCASMWRAEIGRRGWTPVRAFSVQMPNTYVCMRGFDVDPQNVETRKLEAMPQRVAEIAGMLHTGPDQMVTGSFAWIKTRIVYPWFIRMDMSPKPFRALDSCIACGKCMRVCPMANITPDAVGRPVWGKECALCLACYHVCPRHAVAYGSATLKKGQYRLK